MHGGKPWMTEFDNPFVQAAGRAIEKGFGKAPVFNREGGSIPVVATFQEILGAAVRALRRRPARRERARAEREARSRELPRRHHRVGVSLRRNRQDSVLKDSGTGLRLVLLGSTGSYRQGMSRRMGGVASRRGHPNPRSAGVFERWGSTGITSPVRDLQPVSCRSVHSIGTESAARGECPCATRGPETPELFPR